MRNSAGINCVPCISDGPEEASAGASPSFPAAVEFNLYSWVATQERPGRACRHNSGIPLRLAERSLSDRETRSALVCAVLLNRSPLESDGAQGSPYTASLGRPACLRGRSLCFLSRAHPDATWVWFYVSPSCVCILPVYPARLSWQQNHSSPQL